MTEKDWLKNNKLGIDIFNRKYRFKKESFEQWLKRVSGNNESVEKLIRERKFLFGGRTLTSRGTGNGLSFSNCYSSGYAPDSVKGMLELNTNLALTYQSSGGQGLSLSRVRPKGADVRNGLFKSDGIVPFMEIFNQTTESISQGGSRKGALMMSLSIWHPEIETFISIKDGTGKITKANLSVELDDEFMKLVENNVQEYEYTVFGIDCKINPTELYNKIMKRAWSSAEPGVIFTNKFRLRNLMEFDGEYKIVTSNPCGEQPLPKNGACNLGSMNLLEYVKNPFTKEARIDFDMFYDDVQTCIEALDDVLEEGKDLHSLPEQREMANNYRNVGLGLMGVASALMALGIPYGNKKSIDLISSVSKIMFYSALKKSALLAKEKGSFPKCDKEAILKSSILKETNVPDSILELIKEYGLRNCSLLSIAPSGSIGTMLDVSTGLEPYYALKYMRKTETLHGDKDVYYEVEVDIAKKAREVFGDKPCVSALNIDWKDRVKLQGVMQFYVDTAISSTVNVREDITVDELRDLYLYSWKEGLKGITIYRENSFQAVLSTEPQKNEDETILDRGIMSKVPEDTIYYPREMNHGCGKAKVMVGYSPSENRITDVYHIEKGKGGCSKNTQGEAILISQVLRLGGNLEDIKKSFGGIGACTSCTVSRMKGNTVDGINCPNILLKIVLDAKEELVDKNKPSLEPKNKVEESKKEIIKENTEIDSKYICPECSAVLHPEGACFTCTECGYSKCE